MQYVSSLHAVCWHEELVCSVLARCRCVTHTDMKDAAALNSTQHEG